MRPTILIEQLDLSEAVLFTAEKRIENVVLIRAGMSANRRFYSESVLETAAPVFNGIRAYANHPRGTDKKEGRSVRDLSGWYENVRYENGALKATRGFFDTEAGRDTWAIAEAIISGRAPKGIAGLSINAAGTGQMDKFDDGEALRVEAITMAFSVDDVDVPAAKGGYSEADNGDELATALVAAMTYEEYKQAHPAHLERLKLEWKAVRLEEATKTALAEADDKVKQAQAESSQAKQALEEAQTTITTLTTERDTALSEAAQARRELAIERLLNKPQIPATWKADLREQLGKADPDQWDGIIEREIKKAKSAGATARVPVTGSGQQVSRTVQESKAVPVIDWSQVKTPEQQAALMRQIQERG